MVIGDTTRVSVSIDELSTHRPKNVSLHQNYPNPFNPATQIRFTLPEQSQVSLLFLMSIPLLLVAQTPQKIHDLKSLTDSILDLISGKKVLISNCFISGQRLHVLENTPYMGREGNVIFTVSKTSG